MSDFDALWRTVTERSSSFPVVQEYNELKHVFERMRGKSSYLEIGSAEGNSLYVLAHALNPGARITYVDLGEPHTKAPRDAVVKDLRAKGYHITEILADSTSPFTPNKLPQSNYDCVMIDAGHQDFEVLVDAIQYAWRAKHYCFFHDVCLPDVRRAFTWYADYVALKPEFFINSATFGYGILKPI